MPGVDSESGPSTRKQGHKSARDKASGAGRLGSGKGARALEANQARRGGAKFRRDQLVDSRCPLLGYALKLLQVEGVQIPIWFLRTELQSEIGLEAYDAGARMLANFFKREVGAYLQYPDLDPVGAEIIRACLNDADLATYEELLKPI